MKNKMVSCANLFVMQRMRSTKIVLNRMAAGTVIQGRRSLTREKYVFGEEVCQAKENNIPIVALESTIITHGMPYPDNLHTASRVENTIRKQGVVPATIGILNGRIHIGMDNAQLETLARADQTKTLKCSRRDLSFLMSNGLNGGTTVSATLLLAKLADIPIMATGGIGGVHREAETTFDISADLIELGRTPVAVVCSGVKSILDIGKTLEFLETQGVPVITIGDTNDFPAFFCRTTVDKLQAPHRVSNCTEAAKVINCQRAIGLETGILFAVPIPIDHALNPQEVENIISVCLKKAKSRNVHGKNLTPFLLQELNEKTHGQTLQANMALIEHNAKTAAEIAKNLKENGSSASETTYNSVNTVHNTACKPVIVGGAVYDTVLQVKDPIIKDNGSTHAGRSKESCGGVGRNVAEALICLGLHGTRLLSVIGDDQPGRAVIKSLREAGTTVERVPNANTARYTAIIDSKGECRFGIGEMDVFGAIDPALIKRHQSQLEEASFIILDGNVPMDTIRLVVDIASQAEIPVWYEPTDVVKASKIFESKARWENALHFISPNKNELLNIGAFFGVRVPSENSFIEFEELREIAENVAEYIPVVISTLGADGVLVTRKALKEDPFYDSRNRLVENTVITSHLYPTLYQIPKDTTTTFSASGCGDCLTAGIIFGIHKNWCETNCIMLGLEAAALSLKSFDPVPSTLATLNIKKFQ